MVRIRLRRMGAKKQPFYRIVVADSRSPRDGRFLDTLGTYDPRAIAAAGVGGREKALRWLEEGATPTDSARALLSRTGIWQEFRGHGAIPMGPTDSEPPASGIPGPDGTVEEPSEEPAEEPAEESAEE